MGHGVAIFSLHHLYRDSEYITGEGFDVLLGWPGSADRWHFSRGHKYMINGVTGPMSMRTCKHNCYHRFRWSIDFLHLAEGAEGAPERSGSSGGAGLYADRARMYFLKMRVGVLYSTSFLTRVEACAHIPQDQRPINRMVLGQDPASCFISRQTFAGAVLSGHLYDREPRGEL